MVLSENKIPITILICDDDEGDQILAQTAFRDARLSNTLRFVDSGAHLLDYLYQRRAYSGKTGKAPRPGLILLAADLSKRDGQESLKTMKADPGLADIPVMMLSAQQHQGDNVEGEWPGANSYMAKPVTFAGLVQAMSTLDRHWFEIVESVSMRD